MKSLKMSLALPRAACLDERLSLPAQGHHPWMRGRALCVFHLVKVPWVQS